MTAYSNNVRPLHAARSYGETKPRDDKPFKAKGHDIQLNNAESKRLDIEVVTLRGSIARGRMVRRDRYTITVRVGGQDRCFFKHALESFYVFPADDTLLPTITGAEGA